MNRTKIEWCDYTWNPIVGCTHWKGVCSVSRVCYARRMAKRQKCKLCREFVPHLHPERLDQPYKVKKPVKIFVGSMGDMFDQSVPRSWILRVIRVTLENPQHTFMFLTKNPSRYSEFMFPSNCWLGTTVNTQNDVYRILQLCQNENNPNEDNIKFISFEPLYGPVRMVFHDPDHVVDWIIIGAQTNPLKKPAKRWVLELINQARCIGAKIFLKDNLGWRYKIQEFPGRKEVQTCLSQSDTE